MKIKKSEILDVISKVKPAVSSKVVIEQASHLIFSNNEVVTFNDRLCIMHPFSCDQQFSVKEAEFTKIIGSVEEAEFDLVVEGDTVKIKSKSTKASLTSVLGDEAKVEHLVAVIKDQISQENFWKPLPKEFLDGIYLCAFSANKDVATGVRTCVAVKGDLIFSTDNLRAGNYVMDSSVEDVILIPAKEALELVKYKVKQYGMSDNWAHFKTEDGIVFNCKSLKGDYPFDMVTKQFLDIDAEFKFPSALKVAVDSVIFLAEGEEEVNKTVTVMVNKTNIIVKAQKERGWIEKIVPFENAGREFEFLINPIFFSQILQHSAELVVVENRVQFTSDNFYHVMALPIKD